MTYTVSSGTLNPTQLDSTQLHVVNNNGSRDTCQQVPKAADKVD